MTKCTITVERIPGGYRARCDLWPDCEAVAPTEDQAREAVLAAIENHLCQEEKKPQIDADQHR